MISATKIERTLNSENGQQTIPKCSSVTNVSTICEFKKSFYVECVFVKVKIILAFIFYPMISLQNVYLV